MTEVNRNTAQHVFRLLGEGASLARASVDTGLSESTVSRLSRARRWLDEGLPDDEISRRLAGAWSRERIDHLRDWHGGARSGAGEARADGSPARPGQPFLARHVESMSRLAVGLRESLDVPAPASIVQQAGLGWPDPWHGRAGSAPMHKAETDPLFEFLISHLARAGIRQGMEEIRQALLKYRQAVSGLADRLEARLQELEDGSLTMPVEDVMRQAFVLSLVHDVYWRVRSGRPSLPEPEVRLEMEPVPAPVLVRFGGWAGPVGSEGDAEAIVQLHGLLRLEAQGWAEARAAAAAGIAANGRVERLRRSLQPDDLVWRRLLDGRCRLCR
ncbi:MAG: hypothetical protein WD208_11470 [Dehalococcoidia bacterium]